MTSLRRLLSPIGGALLVAACTVTGSAAPSIAERSAPLGSASPPSGQAETATAPWRAEALVDVRTGSSIRLVDLQGRIVFLEGMATWCPPCLEQQREAEQALRQLDPETVVYLSVDIDPRESDRVLRDYVARHRFTWSFVVGSPAFLRELAEAFGTTILNPPATPVVLIDATGHGTLTEVGIKHAARLIQLATTAGA
jgi:cytochrome oxidase Cu insertion factor (SCO1/SenC/PrrC family)